METKHIIHQFEPIFDENSRILILGSLPSVRSREVNFYYGHPRNRFWRLIAAVTKEPLPVTVPQKKELLLRHNIAICDITGSSDSSVRNVVPADLSVILLRSHITSVFTNGSTASSVYRKYQLPLTGIPDIQLPSSSPANAAWSFERLESFWSSKLTSAADGTDV